MAKHRISDAGVPWQWPRSWVREPQPWNWWRTTSSIFAARMSVAV